MIKNRWFVLSALIVVFIVSAAIFIWKANKPDAVSSGENGSSFSQDDNAGNGKIKIGVSVMNYVNEYWVDLIDGVEAYCKDAGYEVISAQANDDANDQAKSLNDFIDQGVSGIIVSPINETVLEPVIQRAMDKGIKVIAHIHDLNNFNIQYGPKEYEMGFIAGRYMGKLLKNAGIEAPKLAMLNYPDLATLIDREKGLEDGIREFVPEATIIDKRPGHKADMGKAASEAIIKEYPKINGFVGINDNGLLGALEASQELGLDKRKDFFIVGIGGDTPALEAIKEGTPFKATVNLDPWLNGYNEAIYMKEMLGGKNYMNKVVYFSPLSIIDSSNVDEVLKEKQRRRTLNGK